MSAEGRRGEGVVRLIRDETCPNCGWPETYAEANLDDQEAPGADAIGCAKCGWRVEAIPPASEHFHPGQAVIVAPSAPRRRDGFRAAVVRVDHHGDLHLCVTETYNGSGRHPKAGSSRVLHPERVRPLKENNR